MMNLFLYFRKNWQWRDVWPLRQTARQCSTMFRSPLLYMPRQQWFLILWAYLLPVVIAALVINNKSSTLLQFFDVESFSTPWSTFNKYAIATQLEALETLLLLSILRNFKLRCFKFYGGAYTSAEIYAHWLDVNEESKSIRIGQQLLLWFLIV